MYFELVRCSILIHYLLKIQLLQRFLGKNKKKITSERKREGERERHSKLAMEWEVGEGGGRGKNL